MAEKITFTEARLRDLEAPAKGRLYYRDSRCPGLQVCVTAAGAKTYYFVRRIDGRPTRVRVGRAGELPLSEARKQAGRLGTAIDRGEDPQADRQAKRDAITFGVLFEWYMEHHARPHKRTAGTDQQQYDRYVKRRWGKRHADSIRKKDVLALHTTIGSKHGIYAANRLRSLLHKVFALAIDNGLVAEGNPVHGVKRFAEKQRDRFLSGDELRRFFVALAEEPSVTVRDYLTALLLTGARRGNVLTMAWQDIDLHRGIWRIPRTKSGEPLLVPLSPQVVGLLQRRHEERGDSPWVFPGRHGRAHLTDPTRVWKRVVSRAGLEDVRLHDLRRTMASWQAMAGSTLQVIGKSLGHRQTATTEIYARLQLDPVRESIERATDAMLEAGGADF